MNTPVCHQTCGLVHLLPRARDYLFPKRLRFPLLSGEAWLGILGIILIALGLSLQKTEAKCCSGTPNTFVAKTAAPAVAPPETKTTAEAPTKPLMDGLSWMLIGWGGWLLSWRILRGGLWTQYYKRGLAGLIRTDLTPPILLPSQATFVNDMTGRLSSFNLIQPGPLWAIRGTWGSGKSYLMAALHQRLEANEQVAVAYIHIWREQTEHDLHLAIVEAILSHPKILRECFSAYPNRMVLRKIGHVFSRMMHISLKTSNGSLEALLDPQKALPLIAQHDLEQVVACARRKGLRIVAILDEVDRATIPVAQAAIVLTRRALGLPGLAVVLPYVEEQLRLKVFNPMNDFSPDLHQTFLVNLEHQQQIKPSEGKAIEELVERLHFEKTSNTSNTSNTSTENKTEKPTASKATHWSIRRELHEETLLRHYWNLPEYKRKRLIEQTAEKYLSLRINLPRLIDLDIPDVLRFPTVLPSLTESWHPFLPNEQRGLAFGRGTVNSPSRLKHGNRPPPAIRHFEGYLAEYLDQLKQFSTPTTGKQKELLILGCAVLAWRKAQQLA